MEDVREIAESKKRNYYFSIKNNERNRLRFTKIISNEKISLLGIGDSIGDFENYNLETEVVIRITSIDTFEFKIYDYLCKVKIENARFDNHPIYYLWRGGDNFEFLYKNFFIIFNVYDFGQFNEIGPSIEKIDEDIDVICSMGQIDYILLNSHIYFDTSHNYIKAKILRKCGNFVVIDHYQSRKTILHLSTGFDFIEYMREKIFINDFYNRSFDHSFDNILIKIFEYDYITGEELEKIEKYLLNYHN